MPCKKKVLNDDILEQVKKFFEQHNDKSYRAGEIAEQLGLEKEEVSAAIKELKNKGIITGRCAYKLA